MYLMVIQSQWAKSMQHLFMNFSVVDMGECTELNDHVPLTEDEYKIQKSIDGVTFPNPDKPEPRRR
jgi:hypothetical protein